MTAIDAGGVGELVRLRQSASRLGVAVIIEAAGPRVRRVLGLTRLDTVFGLVPSSAPTGLASRLPAGPLRLVVGMRCTPPSAR